MRRLIWAHKSSLTPTHLLRCLYQARKVVGHVLVSLGYPFCFFLILTDSIFVMFDGRVFQQTVSIPMGTNCAPLLADVFLYLNEADLIQRLLKKNKKQLAWSFNFAFRYIDDVLSLNNSRLGYFVDRIYPIYFDIMDTTDTDIPASYIDIHLEIDREGRLRTKLYDKRDYFNFLIVKFPFICINIQQHLHMEYISLSWSDIPIRISLIESCC